MSSDALPRCRPTTAASPPQLAAGFRTLYSHRNARIGSTRLARRAAVSQLHYWGVRRCIAALFRWAGLESGEASPHSKAFGRDCDIGV